jgi:DNA-directed RNA polymerase subunit H (RpoH/RPB5)
MDTPKFKSADERALDTLKTILTARGFKAEAFDSLGSPLDETNMYTFGGALVIFSNKTRVTEKELNNFLTYASDNNYSNSMIVVTLSKPSEAVLAFLRDYISQPENMLVQMFEIRKLQFDISKHRDVPKHRILNQEERTAIMKEYNIMDPLQCPRIDSQDPMAKWVGARPGDMIEVKGLDEASAFNPRPRICVANVYDQ